MEEKRIYAIYITDSRGAWLSHQISEELRRQNRRDIIFTVIYRKGAGMALLWELAERTLLTRRVDILFIAGGICDITKACRSYQGRREFSPNLNLDDHFSYVIDIMDGMRNNFTLLDIKCKFCFVPEPGADLIRYNQICHPVPWELLIIQEELDSKLESLLDTTRKINLKLICQPPGQ